ncbi:RALBP1 family protein [Megaselia abdita]
MDLSDYSDIEDQQPTKKELRKDKRDKKKDKDKGYAHLEGESSHEEDIESPFSKSKKSKSFKFTSSKSKDKPEKKRDNDKKDKEQKKDYKCKYQKEKRDKEDQKNIYEIGDIQPVFGVSVNLSTDFSRCHDGIDIPLVVRDCIDYLQDNALKSEQIYKVEPVKGRLQHFKRTYNNHECKCLEDFDIPTACGLLKLFLEELPEPVLTTDLTSQFEEASAIEVTKQQEHLLTNLINLLPKYNRTLLCWIFLHFESVIRNGSINKMNAQSLSMLLSPVLQMSHRLMMCLLFHSSNLFKGIQLTKYIPPLTSSSPNLPENMDEINLELKKQESLLSQIHAEMNAGFISKKREEKLWEVQRIITQLKRKIKNYGKKIDKNLEDIVDEESNKKQLTSSSSKPSYRSIVPVNNSKKISKLQPSISDDDLTRADTCEFKLSPESEFLSIDNEDFVGNRVKESCNTILHESHPYYWTLIRLQIKNEELIKWRNSLKTTINLERSETLKLKKILASSEEKLSAYSSNSTIEESDHEQIVERFIKENALLEHKKNMLIKEIFEATKELLKFKVELTLKTLNV